MRQLGSIINNTGLSGSQFLSEFNGHSIILSIDHGVMTIITHGLPDGSLDKLALVKRLIYKYCQTHKIEVVCCFSKQVFCANPILWDYIKYLFVSTQIRMDCTSDKIIFSVYD